MGLSAPRVCRFGKVGIQGCPGASAFKEGSDGAGTCAQTRGLGLQAVYGFRGLEGEGLGFKCTINPKP